MLKFYFDRSIIVIREQTNPSGNVLCHDEANHHNQIICSIKVNWCSSDGDTTNKNLISKQFIFGKIFCHLLVTKTRIKHESP